MKTLMLNSLLLLMILSGCSTMQSVPSSVRTKVFLQDYNSTFKAIINYCNERSFAITMADKELGLINTDFKENDGAAKLFMGNTRSKLNFSIKVISENKTQIIANASVEKQGGFGSWQQMTMSESQAVKLYNHIFESIEKNF